MQSLSSWGKKSQFLTIIHSFLINPSLLYNSTSSLIAPAQCQLLQISINLAPIQKVTSWFSVNYCLKIFVLVHREYQLKIAISAVNERSATLSTCHPSNVAMSANRRPSTVIKYIAVWWRQLCILIGFSAYAYLVRFDDLLMWSRPSHGRFVVAVELFGDRKCLVTACSSSSETAIARVRLLLVVVLS